MKKRLNLLCICIIVSLALSTSMVFSIFCQITANGFKVGMEAAKTGIMPQMPNYTMAFTLPTNLLEKAGTVENIKTGADVAIAPIISMIEIPKAEENNSLSALTVILNCLMIIGAIYALVQFFKLIRNINRNNIFDWQNVKHLRKLGWTLLCTFAGYFGTVLIANYQVSQVLELRGCEFSITFAFADSTFILGFTALLVAEIFAIGLRMKEEQELTI